MAGPWERYQAASENGPWTKYQAPAEDEWERGILAPVEKNKRTGEMRLAWPQLAVDLGNAVMAPGKAVQGEYGMEIDEATGRPTTVTDDMVKDTTALAAVPSMGGTAAPGVARLASGAPMLTGRARHLITSGLEDAGIPTREAAARLEALGPDAVLADLTPQLQKQAQAIATMPGPGQDRVVSTLAAREEGRNARILADVDAALGASPVPSQVTATIKADMEALRPQYEAVFANASRVNTQQIADSLDSLIVNLRGDSQKAAEKVRGMLNVYGTKDTLDPNPRTLFEVRQAIDGLLQTEQNGKVVALLSDVRSQVDQMLAAAVPGIKDVDAKYAELAKQVEALGTGSTVLNTGKEALRPVDLVEMIVTSAAGNVTGPSGVPFRLSQGARAEIDRLLGTMVKDLPALQKAVGGEGNWNRDKLVALFGAEKTDALLGILEREMRYAATEGPALGGARTQMLKAAQDAINGVEPKPGFVENLFNFRVGSAAAAAGDKTIGAAVRAGRRATNAAVADALMARAGAEMVSSLPYGGQWATTKYAPSATAKALLARGEAPWINPAR